MTVYYNEIDKYAAAWLRNLINAGLIAAGDVDERSITDVSPDDLVGYTQCHFFAGIGGWSYALRLAGWPDDTPVWTGSCPCQPFSCAGKKLGKDDKRHLWPEFCRLISKCRPTTVFGEQVASKDGRQWLTGVFTDLENVGYAVAGADLCAAGVSAPHIRQRLYWVADANTARFDPAERSSERERLVIGKGCRALDDPIRMGNTTSERRGKEGKPRTGCTQRLTNASTACRMVNAECTNTGTGDARIETCAGIWGNRSPVTSQTCGLADPQYESRCAKHVDHSGEWTEKGPKNTTIAKANNFGNYWDRADIIPCADNKVRRIESGTFPLAYGLPARLGRGSSRSECLELLAAKANRVGRLRGYGNAIVPELAEEFIQAYLSIVR